MKKTGLLFFPAFDWAISPTHPEREERLLYTRDQIFEEGLMDLPQITEYKPRLATKKDIARTHFCIPRVKDQITEAHLISAGGTMVIADAFMNGEIRNGFAMTRPPGHHAMRVVHGNRGFCNINNEAIMVDYLRHKYGVKKIAIIDTDVHHGDGTQDIFYHDPDVLFISFHQDPSTIFPGTGYSNEAGGPMAFGLNLNVPLPTGSTDEGIHYILEKLILPVLEEFQPEIVINSAGQDNHYSDPLANMKVSVQGYASLNEKLAPDIAVLEGGYAIETALPYLNTGIILAMAGLDYSHVIEPDYNKDILLQSDRNTMQIHASVEQLLEIWHKRDQIDIEAMRKSSKFYERQKSIFYDTDFIQEKQVEKVRLCTKCPGYLTINSKGLYGSGLNNRVYCISIPLRSCDNCYREAHDEYLKAVRSSNYDFVYLQNKVDEIYKVYSKSAGKEWEEV